MRKIQTGMPSNATMDFLHYLYPLPAPVFCCGSFKGRKMKEGGGEDFLKALKRFENHVDVAGKYSITSGLVFTRFSYM